MISFETIIFVWGTQIGGIAMVFPGLRKWAVERGWRVGKNCVYGDFNGFIFTIYDVKGMKSFINIIPNLTQAQAQNTMEFINSKKAGLKVSDFSLRDNVLIIKSKETFSSMKGREIDTLLKGLTEFFIREGIMGREYCTMCGIRGNHDLAIYNGVVMPVCEECYRKSQDEIGEMAREYELEDKNYSKGVLGAAIGGLLAIIPWVLVSVYLNLYASILGYLIGYASLKGYFLLRGKVGRATRWIIGINTALCVFAAELVTLAIYMIQAGAAVSLENYIISFTNPNLSSMVLKDIGIGLVMAFLGISSIFRRLKTETDTAVPNMRKA